MSRFRLTTARVFWTTEGSGRETQWDVCAAGSTRLAGYVRMDHALAVFVRYYASPTIETDHLWIQDPEEYRTLRDALSAFGWFEP